MSALLRWRQSWGSAGGAPVLLYGEGWTEGWALAPDEFATTGRVTLTADLVYGQVFDIGSGALDMTGHAVFPITTTITAQMENVLGLDPPPFAMTGRATLTADLDFEEPYFIDPPLELHGSGHVTLAGTVTPLVLKSIGSGVLPARGRTAFGVVSFGYLSGVVKPLFGLTLTTTGRSTVTGSISSTTVKIMGAGSMGMSGRSTIAQSGFSVEAPPPYTHPLGSGMLPLIGDVVPIGDVVATDFPATDLGSLTLDVVAHATLATSRLFSGGVVSLPAASLALHGKTQLWSAFSYPGTMEFPEGEAVAVYEGTDMQEAHADLEGDDIVV